MQIGNKTWTVRWVLILMVFLMSAPEALAIEYAGFGARPAFPREDNPRTESIFVHTLTPGQVQDEGVRVVNNSDETKTLLVYAADSIRSTDGAFACEQLSDGRDDVGAWIELEQSEVTLPSLSNVIVPFSITIPPQASVGEHNGCILIQEKNTAPSQKKAGALISIRTGLRVAVTIPGEIVRKLDTPTIGVEKRSNSLFVTASASNEGNVSIDSFVSVALKNIFGKTIAHDSGRFPVLREDIATWNFEFDHPFWGGWYRASLAVAYDADLRATVGVNTEGEQDVLSEGTGLFFVMPTIVALIIEIIVFVAVVIIVRIIIVRRKIWHWIDKTWVDYEIQEGDTLDIISKKVRIPWQLLAKVNNLQPPYILQRGEAIRVPHRKKKKKRRDEV